MPQHPTTSLDGSHRALTGRIGFRPLIMPTSYVYPPCYAVSPIQIGWVKSTQAPLTPRRPRPNDSPWKPCLKRRPTRINVERWADKRIHGTTKLKVATMSAEENLRYYGYREGTCRWMVASKSKQLTPAHHLAGSSPHTSVVGGPLRDQLTSTGCASLASAETSIRDISAHRLSKVYLKA